MPKLTYHGSSRDDDIHIEDVHILDFQDEWELVRGHSAQVFDPKFRLPYQAEKYRLSIDDKAVEFWSCEFPDGTVAIYLP